MRLPVMIINAITNRFCDRSCPCQLFLFRQRNRLHQVTVEVDRVFPELFCFSLCKEVFAG